MKTYFEEQMQVIKIIPYVRKIRPKYTGEDQDMKNFFAIGEAYTEQRTTGKIR